MRIRHEYIVHARAPRFIARAHDERGNRQLPADTTTGAVYPAADKMLCEIAWIDRRPSPKALRDLLEAAADALGEAAGG
jgi:hypothetical protein